MITVHISGFLGR